MSAWALVILAAGLVLTAVGDPGGPPLIAPVPALMAIYAVVLATRARRRHVRPGSVWALRLAWSTLSLAAIPTVVMVPFVVLMSMYQG